MKKLIFIFLSFPEAPNHIVSGVRTETLSSTSIRVYWLFPHSFPYPVPKKRDFDGFYVGFRELDQRLSMSTLHAAGGASSLHSKDSGYAYSFKTISLSFEEESKDFNVTLTDLKRNTRYGIIVQAFNRKGPGPNSEEVIAQTPEFGEYLCHSRDKLFFSSFLFFCNFDAVSELRDTRSQHQVQQVILLSISCFCLVLLCLSWNHFHYHHFCLF